MAEKIEMTQEERRALLGALPFSTEHTIEFTPEYFSKVAERLRPIFTLRPMTKGEMERYKVASKKAEAASADGKTECADADETMSDVVRKHVVGWRNLIDIATCDTIEFVPSEDGGAKSIDMLPKTILSDIMLEIVLLSGLSRRVIRALT